MGHPTTKEDWKFSMEECGEQCVMICSIHSQLELHANNLDILGEPTEEMVKQVLDQEQDLYGWIMYDAEAQSHS